MIISPLFQVRELLVVARGDYDTLGCHTIFCCTDTLGSAAVIVDVEVDICDDGSSFAIADSCIEGSAGIVSARFRISANFNNAFLVLLPASNVGIDFGAG